MSVDAQQFSGTDQYIATDSLKLAVKAARALQKPLLVKGEPGTGKTLLAEQVAQSLGLKLITWHIKSTTKAQQGLYEYDAVSRLRDSHSAIHIAIFNRHVCSVITELINKVGSLL